MSSIFTRIIRNEIPSYKIAETANCFAFLDAFPLKKGHTLVVPKKEIDYLFNLDDALLSELMLFSKKIAMAIKAEIPCLRVGVAVVGLEVPHAHIHLIPLSGAHDIDFSKPKLKLSPEEMTQIAEGIRKRLL